MAAFADRTASRRWSRVQYPTWPLGSHTPYLRLTAVVDDSMAPPNLERLIQRARPDRLARGALFHGSAYRVDTILPSFLITGQLRRWDRCETNRHLYATTSAELSAVMGFTGALRRAGVPICRTRFESSKRVIRLTSLIDDWAPIERFLITRPNWYVYELKRTDGWRPVDNQWNGAKNEYKRKSALPRSMVSRIHVVDLDQFLRRYKVYFHGRRLRGTRTARAFLSSFPVAVRPHIEPVSP